MKLITNIKQNKPCAKFTNNGVVIFSANLNSVIIALLCQIRFDGLFGSNDACRYCLIRQIDINGKLHLTIIKVTSEIFKKIGLLCLVVRHKLHLVIRCIFEYKLSRHQHRIHIADLCSHPILSYKIYSGYLY